MPLKITSLVNSKIKDVLALRRKPCRDGRGVIIDGCREIRRALDGQGEIRTVFYCPDCLEDYELFHRLCGLTTEVFETTPEVFAKISFGDRQEGLVVIADIRERQLDDLELGPSACVLVVENVEKPGNLGAILRTCDGVGVDAVLFCDQQTGIYNPNVVRSSLGTVFTLPVVRCEPHEAAEFLKTRGFSIGAAVPQAAAVYHRCDFRGRVAVVVGREDSGVSPFWKSEANLQFQIPMRGRADSLNVSCATAVILYEMLRQRSGQGS